MTEDLARIAEFDRGTMELVADELVAIPEGWVVRTPSLEWVYYLNHLWVTVPIEAPEALALLERHTAGMPYQRLVIDDQATGERLAAELRAAGWKIGRDVHMAFTGEVDRDLDTSAVTEVSEADAAELVTEWISEDEDCRGQPEMIRQVVEAIRRAWRVRNARHYGVRAPDDSLAAITMLFSDGSTAQVEDVYVTPKARGRGLARTLVTHAVRQALDDRHDFIFILADDEDWPKDFYAKVGFEPVGRVWSAHKRMGA